MAFEWGGGLVSNLGGERSHAFLLRCWQEPDGGANGEPAWRFSLTHINTRREKKGFTELKAMMAYLNQILARENNITPGGKQS